MSFYYPSIETQDNRDVINFITNKVKEEYGIKIKLYFGYDICDFLCKIHIEFEDISYHNETFSFPFNHIYYVTPEEKIFIQDKVFDIINKNLKEKEPKELITTDKLILMRCECCGGTLKEKHEFVNMKSIIHKYQCDYCHAEYIVKEK